MEVSGSPDEPYEVVIFGPSERSYGRFLGSRECKRGRLIYLNAENPFSATFHMI